jgi:hypothetical protein
MNNNNNNNIVWVALLGFIRILIFFVNICFTSNNLGGVCFLKSSFREITFQTFLCLFAVRKVGQRKILSGQRKTLSSQRKI